MYPQSTTRSILLTLAATVALGCTALASAADAIRIRMGTTSKTTDEAGVVWLADTGFTDGDTIDRAGIKVANTPTPSVYTAERYGMSAFSYAVPNGKYTVKLHFAETYEGISAAGERVFSFNVGGHAVKDFDPTAKAGGVLRAYVETVAVEVKDGKLNITFTSQVENPEINAIEIIPTG